MGSSTLLYFQTILDCYIEGLITSMQPEASYVSHPRTSSIIWTQRQQQWRILLHNHDIFFSNETYCLGWNLDIKEYCIFGESACKLAALLIPLSSRKNSVGTSLRASSTIDTVHSVYARSRRNEINILWLSFGSFQLAFFVGVEGPIPV